MNNKSDFRFDWNIHERETQFWKRFVAFYIDLVIIRLFFLPTTFYGFNFFLSLLNNQRSIQQDYSNLNTNFRYEIIISWLVYLLVFVLYSSFLESSKLKSTIGKWFMRYKVLNRQNEKISFFKALLRNILKIASIASVIGVGIIDIFDSRQALHDILAGTKVRKKCSLTHQ